MFNDLMTKILEHAKELQEPAPFWVELGSIFDSRVYPDGKIKYDKKRDFPTFETARIKTLRN
jgi:hypothetical protein